MALARSKGSVGYQWVEDTGYPKSQSRNLWHKAEQRRLHGCPAWASAAFEDNGQETGEENNDFPQPLVGLIRHGGLVLRRGLCLGQQILEALDGGMLGGQGLTGGGELRLSVADGRLGIESQ